MIPSKNQPRTQRIGYKLGHEKRTVELKIATWNITRLFRRLYEDLDRTYDKIPGNVIKVVLGDLNAMRGKETQFQPTIEKESMHDSSNDNELRIISFASSKSMVISSTTFPHKKIHKETWRSLDGKTINQIDHVLIQRLFRPCIVDVRSYRGVDNDMDHFLLTSRFKIEL